MFCKHCGVPLEDSLQTCPNCGKDLTDVTSEAPETAPEAEAEAVTEVISEIEAEAVPDVVPEVVPKVAPVAAPSPAPAPAPATVELPPQNRPLSGWAYFGLKLLFAAPIVGFVFLIVFSFSRGNINRRNFARSYWCELLVFLIILSVIVLIAFALSFQFRAAVPRYY